MKVSYEFVFNDERSEAFEVDPKQQGYGGKTAPPAWTVLAHCKCTNCPLTEDKHKHCPAALNMAPVIERFKDEGAFQKVSVRVRTDGRAYEKQTTLEEGLRSLLGLVMATSACPHLSELRPMAVHHMPFASSNEFIMRSVSLYLLQQLFNKRDGKTPDWNLEGLVERNQRLRLVNQALWQRIHEVCRGDSSLKALLNFFSMASSVTNSLETQLQKVRKEYEAEKAGPASG